MVQKIIEAVLSFPINVLWGNYKLCERIVWPAENLKFSLSEVNSEDKHDRAQHGI
jgi:hypothetical protein